MDTSFLFHLFICEFLSLLVTLAFKAALTSYSGIAEDAAVLFNEVVLNAGDG